MIRDGTTRVKAVTKTSVCGWRETVATRVLSTQSQTDCCLVGIMWKGTRGCWILIHDTLHTNERLQLLCACMYTMLRYIKNILYGQEAVSVRPSFLGSAHFTMCCLNISLQNWSPLTQACDVHISALPVRSFLFCADRVRSGNVNRRQLSFMSGGVIACR